MKKLQDGIFSSGERALPKIATFCYYKIYFVSEKVDYSPLCQPTIGAHGGTGISARQGVDITNVSRPSAEQALLS